MGSKSKTIKKEKVEEAPSVIDNIPEQNLDSDYYQADPYSRQDEWLLKFEVNEKGVGRLMLPPSLSILLQSDRVSIMPTSGGLFIRSV
jgi:hypothetical protein